MKQHPPRIEMEREFLILLAPVWLACRWRIMGRSLVGKNWTKTDLAFDLLGMCDYAAEMKLLVREAQNQRKEGDDYRGKPDCNVVLTSYGNRNGAVQPPCS